jgi:hypothetical protein
VWSEVPLKAAGLLTVCWSSVVTTGVTNKEFEG